MLKTKPWNTVDHLNSHEMVIEYLSAALEEDDPADPNNHTSLLKSVEHAVEALRQLTQASSDAR